MSGHTKPWERSTNPKLTITVRVPRQTNSCNQMEVDGKPRLAALILLFHDTIRRIQIHLRTRHPRNLFWWKKASAIFARTVLLRKMPTNALIAVRWFVSKRGKMVRVASCLGQRGQVPPFVVCFVTKSNGRPYKQTSPS